MANNDIFLHCVKESFAQGGGITPINNYINASATVFVNDISHELTLDSNYTSDYAIESANDNKAMSAKALHVCRPPLSELSTWLSSRQTMINLDVTVTF